MSQSGAERLVSHQFAQFGLVCQAHLERGVVCVEGAAGTPDNAVSLPDGGEFQEYEGCDDQENTRADHLDVARHHDEGRVAHERYGQCAAGSRDQHAVACRGRHEQQVELHPRVAVVERRNREYDHRQPHRAAEIGRVAEEREVTHAAVDDVCRTAAQHEQPVVLRGVKAEEFLHAGFPDGDQCQHRPNGEHVFQVFVLGHRELCEHDDEEEIEGDRPHRREPSRDRDRLRVHYFEDAVGHPDRRHDGQPRTGALPFDGAHQGLQRYNQDVVEDQCVEDHPERQVVGVTRERHDEIVGHEQPEHRNGGVAQCDPQDAQCRRDHRDGQSGKQPVLGERQDEHGHTGGQHCPDDEPGHADRGGYAAVAFHDVSLFI